MQERKKQALTPGTPRWWLSRPPKKTKVGGPGRPSASFDKIISTALDMVDEVGVEAFTLRLLADRLGSGTATLYRHADSKAEYLAYVVDKFLGEVPLDGKPPEQVSWQDVLNQIAEVLYRKLKAHPNLVPLLVSQVPVGPNALRIRELGLRVLLANGFPPRLAAQTYTTVAHYVIGFASQQHEAGAPESRESADLRRFYEKLDPTAFPATFAVAQHLPGTSADDEFHFGLKLIIDGLETTVRLSRTDKSPKQPHKGNVARRAD